MPWPWVDGDTLAAAELNKLVPDGVESGLAYTPQLTATTTNPTLGTGAIAQGRYYRMGKLVWAAARIEFGTSGTGAGSGVYRVSVPVACAQPFIDHRIRCGSGRLVQISPVASEIIACYFVGPTTFEMLADGVAGIVASGVPWAWEPSDRIQPWVLYEAA
ncbi:MAG: hypothetical protein M3N32_07790 [Actinomycetota bacterium]|nr:hypothetical protein [Actinomycetota bacterium]